jgi:hypothetical protein
MSEFLTISDLCRLVGEPSHIVNHALQRFGPAPRGRIGIARVWLHEDLVALRESLHRTAERSSIPSRRLAEATS